MRVPVRACLGWGLWSLHARLTQALRQWQDEEATLSPVAEVALPQATGVVVQEGVAQDQVEVATLDNQQVHWVHPLTQLQRQPQDTVGSLAGVSPGKHANGQRLISSHSCAVLPS